MEDYREKYNKLLFRYYNGCTYLKLHSDQFDKYLPLLLDILNKLNEIIYEHKDMTDNEILYGFDV